MVPEAKGVVLKLTEDLENLPVRIEGGAIGTATVYTESAGFSHVIRKVMMRMEAWMNYINPY